MPHDHAEEQHTAGGTFDRVFHNLFGTYQRRALSLLLLVFVLDYADRTLIGALGPTLKQEFSLNNTMLGLLVTAVSIVSALATIPLGLLSDRTSRTLLLALSFVLWVAAEGLTGAAVGFAMLLLVRIFLGIVSATSGPALPSLVGDLVPARARGRTFGFITSGQIIGVAVGFLLPVIVLGFGSWRWCFWVLAGAGAILAVLFWRLPEPARTGAAGPQHNEEDAGEVHTRVEEIVRRRGIRPSQRALVREPPVEMSLWEAGKYVLRVRTDVIVLIARSIGDFFFQAVATFAVVFATSWYSLTTRQADVVFLAIGLGALAGVLVLGRLGDALLRREWLNSRVWISALAYLLAPFALFPALSSHTLWIALPLYAVGAFLLIGAGPPLDAVRVDVIVPRLRGRAESIRQVLRTLAEGGAPVIIGFLSERLLGGGDRGLWAALVITLPLLFANGLILLLCLRTYPHDIAAALASSRRWDSADDDGEAEQERGAPGGDDDTAETRTPPTLTRDR